MGRRKKKNKELNEKEAKASNNGEYQSKKNNRDKKKIPLETN